MWTGYRSFARLRGAGLTTRKSLAVKPSAECGRSYRRYGSTEAIATSAPPVGIVLAALVGLPLTLWTYKCLMMVLFQRKIIYMGYIPPGSRSEVLREDDPDLKGLEKEDVKIPSDEGVVLRGYVFKRSQPPVKDHSRGKATIVYFQGNVGSPIQRLPLFRTLLLHPSLPDIDLELVAVPPRSFGLSTNRRPSERALLRDYEAITAYASARARENGGKVIWMGHSLGASIATVLLASIPPSAECDGLIFENGFASIPGMVRALYASKWVPYHYLGPLALDTWDAKAVFERAGAQEAERVNEVPIMFVSSDNDELVPPEMMRDLYESAVRSRGRRGDDDCGVTWLSVRDGLHDFAWKKDVWAKSVGWFVQNVVDWPR